jgi:flagellar hook-associated protein 3 FlgL
MRVATDSIYRNILQGLFTRSNDLNKIQEKVSSGKNINRPSDDPISMVSSLNFQTALSQVTQYSQNIQTGNLWLSSSETAISQASDLVTQAKQIATQMGTGDQTDASRTQAAAEVDQLLDQAVSLGNTQVAGKYIFAGYRTSTAPFSKTTDNNGVDTVTYNGDTNDFQIQVGTNEQVTVGKNGKAVFVDSNLFTARENLKQAITNNDLPTIQQQVNILQGTEDSLQTQLADVGIKQNRLTDNQNRLAQWSTNIQDQISKLQNVDYNQAIVELQQKQTAYEIALQSASQISQWNLQNASLFT